MDENILNMQIRTFLKNVGITSHREIERGVYRAIENGDLNGAEFLDIHMALFVPALGISCQLDDEILLK